MGFAVIRMVRLVELVEEGVGDCHLLIRYKVLLLVVEVEKIVTIKFTRYDFAKGRKNLHKVVGE